VSVPLYVCRCKCVCVIFLFFFFNKKIQWRLFLIEIYFSAWSTVVADIACETD
jgi:hypothetical protein